MSDSRGTAFFSTILGEMRDLFNFGISYVMNTSWDVGWYICKGITCEMVPELCQKRCQIKYIII